MEMKMKKMLDCHALRWEFLVLSSFMTCLLACHNAKCAWHEFCTYSSLWKHFIIRVGYGTCFNVMTHFFLQVWKEKNPKWNGIPAHSIGSVQKAPTHFSIKMSRLQFHLLTGKITELFSLPLSLFKVSNGRIIWLRYPAYSLPAQRKLLLYLNMFSFSTRYRREDALHCHVYLPTQFLCGPSVPASLSELFVLFN